MPSFYLNHLYPEVETARAMVKLRARNLGQAGLKGVEIKRIANPDSHEHIEIQRWQLDDDHLRYIGAIAINSGRLVGFADIAEWRAADHFKYCCNAEKLLLSVQMLLHGNHRFGSEPLGIHELVVGDTTDEEGRRLEAIEVLVERAALAAESRAIFVGAYDDKDILSSLAINGFEDTGKVARGDGGGKRLYIRPPYIAEEDLPEVLESGAF